MFDNKGNYLTMGKFRQRTRALEQPEDIAVNSNGQIYVTDTRNSRVLILEIKN